MRAPRFLTRPLDRRFAQVGDHLESVWADLVRRNQELAQRLDRDDGGQQARMLAAAAHHFAERIRTIEEAPAILSLAERAALFATVVNLRPSRCLEIGTYLGGSAVVIVAALDAIDRGRLVCLDPRPEITPEVWERTGHRTVLVPRASPEAIEDAVRAAGGLFDFVFIDGMHSYEAVAADLRGLEGALRPGALLLLHDVFHEGVLRAADERAQALGYSDLGWLTQRPTMPDPPGEPIFNGMRLLRFAPDLVDGRADDPGS